MNAPHPALNKFFNAEAKMELPVIEYRLPTETIPLDLDSVNLRCPPGLAGQMVEAMSISEARDLYEMYPAAAIQTIAMAARNCTVAGHDSSKLNTSFMVIGLSAAGKDNPQHLMREWLNKAEVPHNPAPRSEAAVSEYLVKQDGHANYIIDEVHGIVEATLGRRVSEYHAATGAVLLQLATSRSFDINQKHVERWVPEMERQVEWCTSKVSSAENAMQQAALSRKIFQLKRGIEHCIIGRLEKPHFCMFGASTFAKMKTVADRQNIDSGFFGRTMMVICNERRAKTKRVPEPVPMTMDASIVMKLRAIAQGKTVTVSQDANELAEEFFQWVEHDSGLIHDEVYGAVWSRADEMAGKISTILACGTADGVVTEEIMRYSIAFVVARIKDLLQFCDNNNGRDSNEDNVAVAVRWTKERLASTGAVTYSQFNNNFRDAKWYQSLNTKMKTEIAKHGLFDAVAGLLTDEDFCDLEIARNGGKKLVIKK
ncbi:MAG: DUF3987 domain-containing protein [Shewanella sp.]